MTRDQRLVLWIAILASFVAFLDGTIVNVALPAMLDDFGGGLALQQWVVDAYLITLGALILIAGSVSDLFGRIRVLRVGVIAFGVTSLAVALAPTAEVLIGARLAQGAAGAMLVPSSLALITSTFSGAAQSRAIGSWTAYTSGAMIAGPIIGGLFVDLASWRWAFVINVVPVTAVVWMLARLGRRDVRSPGARVDVLGAVLGAAGLGAVVFALIESPVRGWGDPLILTAAIGGAAVLAAFVWWQATASAPMMPLGLFRIRNFGWGNLSTFFVYGALGLVSFVISVYLQQGAGLTATQAGLASLPVILSLIALSSLAGAWAGRLGPRLFMTAGPIIAAVGMLGLLLVREDFHYWTQVLPGIAVVGIGIALTVSPLTSAILGAVEPARSGIASAVNNAVARIAGLVTVAVLGAVVGGALDLDGFHRAAVFTAALLAVGGVVAFIGIRNPAAPAQAPAAEAPGVA